MPRSKKATQQDQSHACCQSNNNRILYAVIAVIAVFSVYLFLKVQSLEKKLAEAGTGTAQQGQQEVKVKIDQVKKLFSNDYIHFGNANKKLLFVEISDPSCPFCGIAAGKNNELAKEVGSRFQYAEDGGSYIPPVSEIKKLVDQGKASFVYLYTNGHGNGRLAAQSLYCAYEKNKFWEAHDKLMSGEGYKLINEEVTNDKAKIPQLANFLSDAVDSNFLTQCLESGKYEKKLARDEQLSPSLGFQGTPTFLVNTAVFPGAYSFSDMKTEVDKNL